jgi:hypothetical protein
MLCLQSRHENKQEYNLTSLNLMTLLTEYCICLTFSCVLRFCLVLISFVFVVMYFVSYVHICVGFIFELCGVKVKVMCTLVQALRLCTGRTAHRGSSGIALLFHDHGTRRG